MAGKRYDVGVLFVHGMGEQQRGDTLTEMGEAVMEWLSVRLADEPQRPTIRRATLRSDETGTAEVAEAEITFDPRPPDEAPAARPRRRRTTPVRWLLRESRWADTFRPATFIETMLWAVSVGPWLMAYQLDGINWRVDSRKGAAREPVFRAVRSALGLLLSIAAALAAAVVAPLAIGIALLSVLPIPLVHGLAQAAQRNLAGSFGDLSVLVRSPFRFAAMSTRVARDIDRLAQESDMVAVVAHSQGSAVGWQAIRRLRQRPADDGGPLGIRLFISFGQALRKLKMLYLIHTEASARDKAVFVGISLVTTVALVIFAVFAILSFAIGPFDAALRFGRFGVANALVAILAIAVAVVLEHVLARRVRPWADRAEQSLIDEIDQVRGDTEFQWIDFWASADPAPNGELLRRPGSLGRSTVQSYKVRNFGSMLLDHSVYWKNTTEFVTAVVHAIAARSSRRPEALRRMVPAGLVAAVPHRHLWVDVLVAGRLVYAASAAAVLIAARDAYPVVGSWLAGLVAMVPGVPETFSLSGWPVHLAGFAILAVLVIGLWVLGGMKAWETLLGVESHAAIRGTLPSTQSPRVAGWVIGMAAFALLVFGWLLLRQPLIGLAYAATLAVGIPVSIRLLGGGGRSIGEPPSAGQRRPARAGAGAEAGEGAEPVRQWTSV